MVGIGESTNPDAREAGREMALAAREALAGEVPGWAIVFGGGQHDGHELLAGLHDALPSVPVVGGSAAGAISNFTIGSTGYECAMALFSVRLGDAPIVLAGGLDDDEHAAGAALGAQLRDVASSDSTVLLFYDSVRSAPPPVLHIASRLMSGVYDGLGDLQPTIIGGGTLCDLELNDSYVFTGDTVSRHSVVAVVIPRQLRSHTTIMHGCHPVSSFLEITRIDGAKVYELDGQPATDVLADRLGVAPHELASIEHALAITLGRKQGDPFEPYDESKYVNRMVVGVDPDAQSITLFEADFEVGARVQIMVSDVERMNASAQSRTDGLLAQLPADRATFGLYIDCAGRSPTFCGADVIEASIVAQRVGALCPLLGFFSGVEIAPLQGQSRPLDWTGVLTVFTSD